MNGVKGWLQAEAERVARLPCLEDALFGFHAARYAVYRVRYAFVQGLLRTLFRLLEVGLFVSALPVDVLGSVLVVRSVMLVGEGLWWGALETLRRDVRASFKRGRLGQASQRIRQWMALAFACGGGSLLVGGLWVWLGPSPFSSFSALDAFLLGCCARWCIDLLVATYHAGVYGVRRVYRPIWSLVVVDVADVVLLALAFLWIGVWGVGCALVAVGSVRAGVVWWFTRRVYAGLKLDAGMPRAWARALRRKPSWSVRHSLEHAASNIVAQSDALLVLGLLSAPGHAQSSLLLAALFHVVAPLQSAASVWSRLFYFDFKRLEAWGSPLLLRRFEEFLSLASWWVPLPIGLVTLTLMSMLWRGPYWVLAIELAGLAVVRSRLALVHIRAYSLADHGFMLKLFVGIIGIAAVTPFLTRLPPEGALGVVVGLMATGLLVLGRSQRPLALRAPHGLVEPSIWLSHLLRANEPVQLGLARVDRRLSTVGRLARALRDPIGDGVQARLSNDTLVWFSRQRLSVREIVERGAGTLRELELGQLAVTGRNALDVGLESTTWKRRLGNMLAAERDGILDLGALQARLSCAHPDARIIELTSRRAFVELGATNVRELRRLLLDATHGMSRFRALGENEVAVVAPAGEPLALIVVPKRTRPAQEWKRSVAALVEWANIAWTLHHTR